MDVLIDAGGRARAPRRPSCRSPSAGSGRDRSPARDARARAPGARSRSSAGCPTTTSPRVYGAPTSTPCCAATGGPASSRRASASCSSRRPPPGCPRSPGNSGGAAEAVVDGETGLVVDDPTDVGGRGRGARTPARRRRPAGRDGRGGAQRAPSSEFDYDHLAARLAAAIEDRVTELPPPDPTRHDRRRPGRRRSSTRASPGPGAARGRGRCRCRRPRPVGELTAVVSGVLFASAWSRSCGATPPASSGRRDEQVTLGGLFFLSHTAPEGGPVPAPHRVGRPGRRRRRRRRRSGPTPPSPSPCWPRCSGWG